MFEEHVIQMWDVKVATKHGVSDEPMSGQRWLAGQDHGDISLGKYCAGSGQGLRMNVWKGPKNPRDKRSIQICDMFRCIT